MINLNKKIAAFSMAVVMIFSATACSNGAQSNNSTSANNSVTSDNNSASETSSSATDESKPDNNVSLNAKVTIDGTKFMVDGKEIWFNGANTPWDKWNDFGGSFNSEFWDSHFAQLEEAGVNASRIWINCNGMTGVKLKEDGSFDSVTDKHWEDLDKLFEIAQNHGIYIMATLLSFDHFKESNTFYDRWRAMITNSDNIDSFVKGYVIPFVQRYDNNDYLWSVDLINEPDWVFENAECGKISWDNLSEYFARAAAGIHENSDVLVTVGLAMVKYNSDLCDGNKVSDAYLQSLYKNDKAFVDFYSTHYYYWQFKWYGMPFDRSLTDFKMDTTKPCVVGECAAVDESKMSLKERYEGAYNNGWNGVFAWTSNGVDDCGGYDDLKPASTNMLSLIKDKIYPLGK